MRSLRIGIALAVVFALVVLASLIMGWPVEKAVYLAPVIVVAVAALAGLLILWGKVAVQSLRESKRPRLVLGLWVGGIALLVVLSVLGVNLPREGG
jgi:predicted neutral ceramidase superfamily lipid hydrolase